MTEQAVVPQPYHRWRANEDLDFKPGWPDHCLACGVRRYPLSNASDPEAGAKDKIAAGPCPKG